MICGRSKWAPVLSYTALCDERKGSQWWDVIGCGAEPLFIVSEYVLEAWRKEKIKGVVVGGEVRIAKPYPERMRGVKPFKYFWIDGEKMRGAELDFDAGGFVSVTFCPKCGSRDEDISATYDRQCYGTWPYVFKKGTWRKTDLFTTDLSPAAFFCTQAVMECARKHKLTNFRFIPVEAGAATWSKGIDYLGKQWPPPPHPLRRSEGKTLDEWIELLKDEKQRWTARCAILDFGPEAAQAVPKLIRMLSHKNRKVSGEAYLLMAALRNFGIDLGKKGNAAANKYEKWYRSTFGRPETT